MLKSGRLAFALCHNVAVSIAAVLLFTQARLQADTYTVTNTADFGPGSLRQAVLNANLHLGADTIHIDSALSGATIELFTSLPALTEKVSIDSPPAGSLTIRFVSYSDIFSGGFPLTKENSGTLIFSGNNSYSGGTTVNGGALQGNSWSLKGDIVNNSAVIFDQDIGDGAYAGNITGAGSFTKIGPFKLTLTGTNTYSGGTAVNAGLLEGDTNALSGNIFNNSAVIFDQPFKGTYAGNMSGSGSLTKTDAGTLILSGINTYTGLTIVTEGILQGNTSSLPSDIVNGSAVIFDQPFDGIYAGKINFRGSVTKEGAGTLTLTGANSYTGRTVVNQGTLRGNTTSLQGSIINNSAVLFDQAFDGVYAGAMSGPGALTKLGAGTLTLSGINTYTGITTVAAGRLAVTGQITSPISIQGGTLALAGNNAWVTDSVNLGGAPSAPAGTLDVGAGGVVVDYPPTGVNPSPQIRQQIIAARGGTSLIGGWTGRGITSSAAVAAPQSLSVGYANNGGLPLGPYSAFLGRPVDATSVLIRGTRTGDATLDGIVGDDDISIVGATFGMRTGADWSLGDFDYDGDVDDNDVTLVSALYNPTALPLVVPVAAVERSAGGGGLAAVPEPATWWLFSSAGLAAAGIGAWKRRYRGCGELLRRCKPANSAQRYEVSDASHRPL